MAAIFAKLFLRVQICEYCRHCASHLPFWVKSAAQSTTCAIVLKTVDFKSDSGSCLLHLFSILIAGCCRSLDSILLPICSLRSFSNHFKHWTALVYNRSRITTINTYIPAIPTIPTIFLLDFISITRACVRNYFDIIFKYSKSNFLFKKKMELLTSFNHI